MKDENKRSGPLITALAILLVLCGLLTAGIVNTARIVPVAAGGESRVFAAGEASYWLRADMDPTEIYELAKQQCVYIHWSNSEEEGAVSGSGIVASEDGYILTNAHVVSEATADTEIIVEFFNGITYTAKIVGFDNETDVALIKIDAKGLKPATFGQAKGLKPCETVYAVGNPGSELTFTITSGIVSGLDREISFSDGTTLGMFQFDAPVNPGNSGGPVYDASGRVVGIVTAKYVNLTTEGISFAIPIESSLDIAAELKQNGYVKGRPLLGITVTAVTAGSINESNPSGMIIRSVEAGLAADRAGLKKGDIITDIGGNPVTSLTELNQIKKNYHAYETVPITVWRAGTVWHLNITFDEVTPEHPTGNVTLTEEEEADLYPLP